MSEETKPKRGRPTSYTHELADRICERLAAGESLFSICRDDDMPTDAAVRNWALTDREGFFSKYARAREIGLDRMADELIQIADTPEEGVRIEESEDGRKEVREDMLGHRRLKVDTRKWYLSKLAPKKYGDRVTQEISGPDGGAIKHDVTLTADEAYKRLVDG